MNADFSMSIKNRADFEKNSAYFEKKIQKINKKIGWEGPFCHIKDKVSAILNDKDNPVFFLQLEKGNKKIIAGYVIGKYKIDAKKGLKVRYLAIHPDYSRQGYGTKLMKEIFTLAVRKNVVVSLKHGDSHQLHEFYGRFKPIVRDSSHFLDLDMPVKPIFDPKISLQAINENYRPAPNGDLIAAANLLTFLFALIIINQLLIQGTKYE